MILKFGIDAEFFFQGWRTGDSVPGFIIALVIVAAFGFFVSVVMFRAPQKRILFLWEPLIEFVAMYLIMTYNFWVILGYVVGRTAGYFWAAYQRKISIGK